MASKVTWRMCSLCQVPIASEGCAHIEHIDGRVVMSEFEHERLLARIDELCPEAD